MKMFEKERYIGEVYCYIYQEMSWVFLSPYSAGGRQFHKFKKSDISDYCDNKVKIFGKWVDKDDLFYYDNIYNSLRDKIKNRQGA